MRNKISWIFALCITSIFIIPAAARADENFSGRYEGAAITVTLAREGDGYVGEIRMGPQRFPLKATDSHGRLSGSFAASDGNYDFTASLENNEMTLVSGGTSYAMKKQGAVNPLAAMRPRNPLANIAPGPAAGDALTGYTVVTTSDFGRALTANKPNAADVKSAFQATFPDLARFFGERPAIVGVFEDVKDHRSGGASFNARLNGRPVTGFVSCKIGEKGATVVIVYCRSDAPKGEWARLTATPAVAEAAPAAQIRLRQYQFPDGTGTVGVAEGWTTTAQSMMSGVVIQGPAEQEVNLAMGATVLTPDNQLLQLQRQLAADARRMGGPPPPPVAMLIAPFSDPVTALRDLMPQLSRMSQSAGGPASTLDRIVSHQKIAPMYANSTAAIITYDFTRTTRGASRHYRAALRIEMTPTSGTAWMFYGSQVLAPAETYERDLPVMVAMAASLRENPQAIVAKSRENIAAANARFEATQRANRELQAAFDAKNRAWEQNQLTLSRSYANFDETIRGYRTVEDTTTGYKTSVDLGNVHDIVDHLNQYSPGRYKEIPLRDELYPLPAGSH